MMTYFIPHVVLRLHFEGNTTRKKIRFDDICMKTNTIIMQL